MITPANFCRSFPHAHARARLDGTAPKPDVVVQVSRTAAASPPPITPQLLAFALPTPAVTATAAAVRKGSVQWQGLGSQHDSGDEKDVTETALDNARAPKTIKKGRKHVGVC